MRGLLGGVLGIAGRCCRVGQCDDSVAVLAGVEREFIAAQLAALPAA